MRYTQTGLLYISPHDDCNAIVDAMLETGYSEDFCVATDFSPEFIARLMEAGFLVMSAKFAGEKDEEANYILLPKLHIERSALFFENLRVKKSIRRYLGSYELKADAEFNRVIDRCVEKHGGDWLTPPLVDRVKKIRELSLNQSAAGPCPVSFALYNRSGELAAGEFGVVRGRVYTSYSGFYEESNAGTVQLILTAHYLRDNGFSFFDLGMPLDYKSDLGAVNISADEFTRLFRG